MATRHLGELSTSKLRLALARQAYERGTVRLADADLAGAECLVASRQGLFAVDRHSFRILAYGQFFGLTIDSGQLYLFEAGDRTYRPSFMGRIVRFDVDGRTLANPSVVCQGLDNGSHQIAIFDDLLHIVDSYRQAIHRFERGGTYVDSLTPIPVPEAPTRTLPYAHMNSICAVDDAVYLMLHNGSITPPRQSEILVFDRNWSLQSRSFINGSSCHDILPLEGGAMLHCGSNDGELIGTGGVKVKLTGNMTRGLAALAEGFVVGTSELMERSRRMTASGSVIFLDRTYAVQGELALPGAPTCIIAL